MTDLDDAARERATRVREKRRERADPDGRVERVRIDEGGEVDLPTLETVPDADLPEALREDLERTRRKVAYGLAEELDADLDAGQQVWPLVVHLGVERLKRMWLSEVVETFETVDELDAPE